MLFVTVRYRLQLQGWLSLRKLAICGDFGPSSALMGDKTTSLGLMGDKTSSGKKFGKNPSSWIGDGVGELWTIPAGEF